jgi:hypothetical protein
VLVAAVASTAAAGKRWATKLQQLQLDDATPATGAAASAAATATTSHDDALPVEGLSTAAADADAAAAAAATTGGPLLEVQMPPHCSLRQLAALLGADVRQLEVLLRDQLGEDLASGACYLCV